MKDLQKRLSEFLESEFSPPKIDVRVKQVSKNMIEIEVSTGLLRPKEIN